MEFPDNLIHGRFLERPNRFIAVVECGGRKVWAHLPNTGRLREILVPGRPVSLARAKNPNRKTDYSLILAEMEFGLVSIDSGAPNTVAAECMAQRGFAPTAGYGTVRREVTLSGSRYDLALSQQGLPDMIVEVKGVTLVREARALFPDAPTERGARQVAGLADLVGRGMRAAVLFMVMRSDADSFAPNGVNDPRFSAALITAASVGVEVYALSCRVTKRGVWADRPIEVDFGG